MSKRGKRIISIIAGIIFVLGLSINPISRYVLHYNIKTTAWDIERAIADEYGGKVKIENWTGGIRGNSSYILFTRNNQIGLAHLEELFGKFKLVNGTYGTMDFLVGIYKADDGNYLYLSGIDKGDVQKVMIKTEEENIAFTLPNEQYFSIYKRVDNMTTADIENLQFMNEKAEDITNNVDYAILNF